MNFPDGSYTVYMIQFCKYLDDDWRFVNWDSFKPYIRESLHCALFDGWRTIKEHCFLVRNDAIMAMSDLISKNEEGFSSGREKRFYKFRLLRVVLDKKSEVIL